MDTARTSNLFWEAVAGIDVEDAERRGWRDVDGGDWESGAGSGCGGEGMCGVRGEVFGGDVGCYFG